MLSITTKSPYAVNALVELHLCGDNCPVPIAELARRREIPVQFLEQLFATLRRAGILSSQRGVKGGYSFARPATQITTTQITTSRVTAGVPSARVTVFSPGSSRTSRRPRSWWW